MKRNLYLATFFVVSSLVSFAQQPGVPFLCPGQQVIAYKIGTNCTVNPYKFYMLDAAGVQSATPFYTLNNTNREVNGLGINGVDGFLYGIEYDRIAVGSSCSFSNFHLVRYDAVGNNEDLGILPAPVGGAAQSSIGCISREGNFIYSAVDASGNRNIGQISSIASLTAGTGTLTGTFKQIVTQGITASYADWAINPQNNKLYSYGIYANGSVSTGTVVEIDPVAGTITCIATPNATEFLDVTRDNFGGIYFAPNGYLYGININTRKLYQVDVTTGAITLMSTMSGSGQIRADMGSCTNGNLVLPVKFTAADIISKYDHPVLSWEMGDVEGVNYFTIESKQNNTFITAGTVTAQADNNTYSFTSSTKTSTVFRIKAVLKSGGALYSPLLVWKEQGEHSISLLQNPVSNGKVELVIAGAKKNNSFTMVSSYGMVVKKGQLTGNEIAVADLKPGIYFISINNSSETLKFVKL